jgi:hypothetical protein
VFIVQQFGQKDVGVCTVLLLPSTDHARHLIKPLEKVRLIYSNLLIWKPLSIPIETLGCSLDLLSYTASSNFPYSRETMRIYYGDYAQITDIMIIETFLFLKSELV